MSQHLSVSLQLLFLLLLSAFFSPLLELCNGRCKIFSSRTVNICNRRIQTYPDLQAVWWYVVCIGRSPPHSCLPVIRMEKIYKSIDSLTRSDVDLPVTPTLFRRFLSNGTLKVCLDFDSVLDSVYSRQFNNFPPCAIN